MVTLAIFTTLCGAVLAFRFRVTAVISAIAVIWAVVLFAGLASGIGGWTIAVAMAITATTLQIGYFVGFLTRVALASARAAQPHPAEAANEPSQLTQRL